MFDHDPMRCDQCGARKDDIGMGGCFCPEKKPAEAARFNFSVDPPNGPWLVSSDFIYVTGFDAVAAASAWCAQRRYTREGGYTITVCIMEGTDYRVVTHDAEWHAVAPPPMPDQRALDDLADACGWGDLLRKSLDGVDAAEREMILRSYVSQARIRAESERATARPLREKAARLDASAGRIEAALRALTHAKR